MATNKRKVMLPHTMGQQGIDVIRSREDIETVMYPAGAKTKFDSDYYLQKHIPLV